MPAGLTVFNDSNTVQIDENYFNLVLIDKQTITFSTPSTTTYVYTVSGDTVVVAVKCFPERFTTTAVEFSGGVWTYRLTFYNDSASTGTTTFTVYAFGRAPPPTENFGLEVFDAAGGRVYHSQMKPLRVVAVLPASSAFTGPPGVNLAILHVQMSMYGVVVFPTAFFETYTIRCDGTNVDTLRQLAGNAAGAGGFVRDGLYAAIDVTNY